jgi:Tfp pilus assembly protein PilX
MEGKVKSLRTSSLYKNAESGLVAIFSVMFFIVLITVITISFLRIMVQGERQATDDQLAASALNAAESGVEDAKRLLVRCMSNPPNNISNQCDSALAQTNCPGVLSNGTLRTDLGLNYSATEGVQVSSDASYLQHYTCLLIDLESQEYLGELTGPHDAVFIPLRATGNFNTIEFSWHDTRPEANGAPVAYPSVFQLPKQPEWEAGNYPAFVRLQYIQHGNVFNVNDLEESSRTVFLSPSDTGNNDFNLADVDSRVGARNKASPVPVDCIPTGSSGERYACSVEIDLGGNITSSTNAYLRVVSLYGGTHFQVRLKSGNTVVSWDGVQPVVDVTGKANDVFRRVETRIRLDNPVIMPNFAIESGTDFCKDFMVTDDTADYSNNCN